jgi:hypothetical protein
MAAGMKWGIAYGWSMDAMRLFDGRLKPVHDGPLCLKEALINLRTS